MKGLSYKQPWATIVAQGLKNIENRNWKTNHRGPLIIHASKGWDQEGANFLRNTMALHIPPRSAHISGALVGLVFVVDCVSKHESPWFFGKWGFILEHPMEFRVPIPFRGLLGIFDVSSDLVKLGLGYQQWREMMRFWDEQKGRGK